MLLLHFILIITDYGIESKVFEPIKDSMDHNKDVWREIHSCISTANCVELMRLLSKHTINLNSFNVTEDGDTILHSAAKSNDVKMIEFVLQRMSPSTKQLLSNMKNNKEQLPSDLLTVRIWAPSTHSLFPLEFRQVVKAVLMLGAKRQDVTPYYPQTHFYKLPKHLLFLILQYAAPYNVHDDGSSNIAQSQSNYRLADDDLMVWSDDDEQIGWCDELSEMSDDELSEAFDDDELYEVSDDYELSELSGDELLESSDYSD
jgi:hypothetical protein